MSIAEPRCSQRRCRHLSGVYQPSGDEDRGEFPMCPAFPQGIPEDIAYGPNLHLTVDPRQVDDKTVYERETSDG